MTIDPTVLGRAQGGDPAAVEQVLDAIATDARRQRRRPTMLIWVVSAVVAVICLLGFVVFVTTDPPRSHGPSPEISADNFSIGIVLGLVAGVAIGWAMGRYRSRDSA